VIVLQVLINQHGVIGRKPNHFKHAVGGGRISSDGALTEECPFWICPR
jgi:hypothetical protein